MTATTSHLTVRLATAADSHALEQLAELDSARSLLHPVLVAERDGELLAATSLRDGRHVADPFVATSDVVALLQVRAAQLNPRRSSRLARRRRPLLASTPA